MTETATGSAPDIGAADITALIMDDHEWFRRQFARLDDTTEPGELEEIWEPLAARLDTHAEAEETIFYPQLLKKGGEDSEDETEDAVHDHNKIRDAIAEAGQHTPGSEAWWSAVGDTRKENSEHLTEEEDEVLPDFRKHATFDLRARLAADWIRFYADHPGGRDIDPSDRDVEKYLAENS